MEQTLELIVYSELAYTPLSKINKAFKAWHFDDRLYADIEVKILFSDKVRNFKGVKSRNLYQLSVDNHFNMYGRHIKRIYKIIKIRLNDIWT